MVVEEVLAREDFESPRELVTRQVAEHQSNLKREIQAEKSLKKRKTNREYKELSKRELMSVISKENQRMKTKNRVNKLLKKKIIYRKGKQQPRPTIVVKSRVQAEPYRSIFFRDAVHNQPSRSLFFA